MTTTNLVLKEYMPVVDYFRQQRRTIELITELDQKVAGKQCVLNLLADKLIYHVFRKANRDESNAN